MGRRGRTKFSAKKREKKKIFDVAYRKEDAYIQAQKATVPDDITLGPCWDDDRDDAVFNEFSNNQNSKNIEKFLKACPHLDHVRALELLSEHSLTEAIKKGKGMIMAPKKYVAKWIHIDMDNPADQDWKEADGKLKEIEKEKKLLGEDYVRPPVIKIVDIQQMYLDSMDPKKVRASYVKTVWPAYVRTKEDKLNDMRALAEARKNKKKNKGKRRRNKPTSLIKKIGNAVKTVVIKKITAVKKTIGKAVSKAKKLDTKKVVKYILKNKKAEAPKSSAPKIAPKPAPAKPKKLESKKSKVVVKPGKSTKIKAVEKVKGIVKKIKKVSKPKLVTKKIIKKIQKNKVANATSQPSSRNKAKTQPSKITPAKPATKKPTPTSKSTSKPTSKSTKKSSKPASSKPSNLKTQVSKTNRSNRISPGKENASKLKKVGGGQKNQKNVKISTKKVLKEMAK